MRQQKQAAKLAKEFARQMGCTLTVPKLKTWLAQQGYFFHYYNRNNAPGDLVIALYQQEAYAACHKSFTMDDGVHKIVLVLENLPEAETVKLILHETGHILLCHTAVKENLYAEQTFEQEEAADFFANQVLRLAQRQTGRARGWRDAVQVGVVVLCCLVLLASLWYHFNYIRPCYYITATGTKYHQEDCQYIQNNPAPAPISKRDALRQGYGACKRCIR